jgi:hypothetical protein
LKIVLNAEITWNASKRKSKKHLTKEGAVSIETE